MKMAQDEENTFLWAKKNRSGNFIQLLSIQISNFVDLIKFTCNKSFCNVYSLRLVFFSSMAFDKVFCIYVNLGRRKFRRQKFRRQKFRRQKFRRQKFRRQKFRRHKFRRQKFCRID